MYKPNLKKLFKVTIESYDIIIYYDDFKILADSEEEAKKLALSGDFESISGDTSYCEGNSKWMSEIVNRDFEPAIYEIQDITKDNAEQVSKIKEEIRLKEIELNQLKKILENEKVV